MSEPSEKQRTDWALIIQNDLWSGPHGLKSQYQQALDDVYRQLAGAREHDEIVRLQGWACALDWCISLPELMHEEEKIVAKRLNLIRATTNGVKNALGFRNRRTSPLVRG